jgi:hypothetical protein
MSEEEAREHMTKRDQILRENPYLFFLPLPLTHIFFVIEIKAHLYVMELIVTIENEKLSFFSVGEFPFTIWKS